MNYNDQYAYYRRAVEETLRCAVPADVPNPLGDAMRYSLLAMTVLVFAGAVLAAMAARSFKGDLAKATGA